MIISSLTLRGDLTLVLSLANFFANLISSFPVTLPSLPTIVTDSIQTGYSYCLDGLGIIRLFIGAEAFSFMRVCVLLVLLLTPFRYTWSFLRWFIKKLPFVHIRE